jgi:asparagine synthetase B (glutamine-hydrolysing)
VTSKLLVGNAAVGGLAGVFDPDGISAKHVRLLEQVTGGRNLLEVPVSPAADAPPWARAVLTGTILNLDDVAAQLGLQPETPAETVLVTGFERWSRDLLARLRGSFALVVADMAGWNAVVAADPTGAHSIFVHAEGGRLLFASEIRLLLRLLAARPAPNRVTVAHWFCNRSTQPPGATLYEGIDEVVCGDCLELVDRTWVRSRYWAPRYRPPAAMTRAEAGELLWTALVDAVGARLGSRGDTGIVMSGGIDSSAVAAAAATAAFRGGTTVRSYSAVFPDDPSVDESEQIDRLVAQLGLENAQVRLEPGGALALALQWVDAWQLPLLDFGYVFERPLVELAAADGVRSLLDGEYGDEGFGTPVYWLADLLRSGRLVNSLRAARRLPEGEASSLRRAASTWCSHGLEGALPLRLHRAVRLLRPRRHVPGFLDDASARLIVETDSIFDWKLLDGPRWWAEKAYLLTVDRQVVGAASHWRQRAALSGLEERSPLHDRDLLEALLRIPPELDFDPVFDRPSIRTAIADRVPESVRTAPKRDIMPFLLQGLAEYDLDAIRGLLGRSAEVYAYAKPQAVRDLLDRPPARNAGGWFQWFVGIWKLTTAECWLRAQGDATFPRTLLDGNLPTPRSALYRRRPARDADRQV